MNKVRSAAAELADSGAINPRLEAEVLLSDVLGRSRVALFLSPDEGLSSEAAKTFQMKLDLRKQGMPLGYLTGKTYFRHLELDVQPGVLIPRPETELLVEAIIQWFNKRQATSDKERATSDKRQATSDKRLRILDIGVGSGAIALSLAHEVLDAQVIAIDISPAALEVAAANASKYSLQSQVKLIQSDIFEHLNSDYHGYFDVIVSNPPYIKSVEIAGLQCEVRDFEPREALDGGPDGLSFYRQILSQAHLFLRNGGLIAFEVACRQAEAVSDLIAGAGCYREPTVVPDYAGIERIVLAEMS